MTHQQATETKKKKLFFCNIIGEWSSKSITLVKITRYDRVPHQLRSVRCKPSNWCSTSSARVGTGHCILSYFKSILNRKGTFEFVRHTVWCSIVKVLVIDDVARSLNRRHKTSLKRFEVVQSTSLWGKSLLLNSLSCRVNEPLLFFWWMFDAIVLLWAERH